MDLPFFSDQSPVVVAALVNAVVVVANAVLGDVAVADTVFIVEVGC